MHRLKNILKKNTVFVKVLAANEKRFTAKFNERYVVFENKYFRIANDQDIKLNNVKNVFVI